MSDKNPKKKPKELEQELSELTDLLKRVQADFENYRKRSQKEKEDFAKYSNSDLVLRLIPVLDNLALAFDHIPEKLEGDEWVHGIYHIRKQLEQVFSEEGVTEILTDGVFDHNLHEAVEVVPSELPEGQIVEVVSRGYMINNRVIRPARVKVSAGKDHGLRQGRGETEC